MSGLILPFDGMTPKLAEGAFVAETATLIGDVEVGAGASIWYGCVLRADLNKIRVGRNTNIQDGTGQPVALVTPAKRRWSALAAVMSARP